MFYMEKPPKTDTEASHSTIRSLIEAILLTERLTGWTNDSGAMQLFSTKLGPHPQLRQARGMVGRSQGSYLKCSLLCGLLCTPFWMIKTSLLQGHGTSTNKTEGRRWSEC